MPVIRKVNVPGLERLPGLSHATIVRDHAYIEFDCFAFVSTSGS